MSVFLVLPTSDLEASASEAIEHALSKVCEEWRCLGHIWVAVSALMSDAIRDNLVREPSLAGSRILVVRVGGDAAWIGYSEIDTDWLVNRL